MIRCVFARVFVAYGTAIQRQWGLRLSFINRPYIAPAIVLLSVASLYGWFLYSPIQFDDLYFFMPGVPEAFLQSMGLQARHLAMATLALGWKWLGTSLLGFRVVSLLLHAGVAIAVFYFLREIERTLRSDDEKAGASLLPLLGALIFAMHPAAVYAAGYLIQRTIVMATLFSVLSWLCLLRGLRAHGDRWLWASVTAFALAVFSKEHAVMVPAVSAALALWWWRTHAESTKAGPLFKRLRPMGLCSLIIAILVVLQVRGLLGSTYELDAPEMLSSISVENPWPLSVLTQSVLFFKYLLLWLLPNPMWMSVDMREPFATSFTAWPYPIGFLAFVIWPAVSVWLIWKGKRWGLLGFAMLAPWLLFFTELSTVRIQESFVLYRSYLWAAPAFCGLLAVESRLKPRALGMVIVAAFVFLFPLSWDRLTTFSHPLLLWDDAERLVHDRQGLTGLERIYRNRGIGLYGIKKFDLAIEDLSKAISINSGFSYAYSDRGAAYVQLKRYKEALEDFDASLRLKPNNARTLTNRGIALEGLGRKDEADDSYRSACSLGWRTACAKLTRQ